MRVTVLTGAGLSAESGIPTFRDANGLWEGHRVEEVATPEAFASAPHVVHGFYDARRAALSTVQPNAAHLALAELEQVLGDDLVLITQNVDDLHERAGSRRVFHMHGRLRSAWCQACDNRHPWEQDLAHWPPCPRCGEPELRPDIVWFGEMPYQLDLIADALSRCDLYVAIGTSGLVHPAARFVLDARRNGARTLELNLDPTPMTELFHESQTGPAGTLVPRWVHDLLYLGF